MGALKTFRNINVMSNLLIYDELFQSFNVGLLQRVLNFFRPSSSTYSFLRQEMEGRGADSKAIKTLEQVDIASKLLNVPSSYCLRLLRSLCLEVHAPLRPLATGPEEVSRHLS